MKRKNKNKIKDLEGNVDILFTSLRRIQVETLNLKCEIEDLKNEIARLLKREENLVTSAVVDPCNNTLNIPKPEDCDEDDCIICRPNNKS